MKLICAVYDKKAKIYDGLMYFDNEAQAVRGFTMATEKNEVFKKWPEDYALYKLGTIEEETGEIIPEIEKLIEASALVPTPDKPKSGSSK